MKVLLDFEKKVFGLVVSGIEYNVTDMLKYLINFHCGGLATIENDMNFM